MQVADASAHLADRADELVAADRRVVGVGAEEPVHVGAADPAQVDLHDRRAGPGGGLGNLDEFEPALAGDETGLHDTAACWWAAASGSLHHSIPRRKSSWYSAISQEPVSISGQNIPLNGGATMS